ncbi:MAG TPA: hypothetical protein VNW29_04715 [Candidatus Sulfotelmatobacter sp.]|jgi:hypothetical protein|nr:hypothetical protein [Candidatus Sulfotelmatobacter sp.]
MVNNKRRSRFSSAEQAILTTLLYSDIFSFPLTKDELWQFLIAKEKVTRVVFDSSLHSLKKHISLQNGYYCILGREAIISKRMQQLPEVAKKLQCAHFVASKLAAIPSILFIGITGGLAVENVTAHDDIDLVIITKKETLFMTRLLIIATLEKLGLRRFRNQKNTADTICTNLLFDETALSWFGKNQDIYTAREIAQIKPLFERKGVYQKFLTANIWIKRFVPNSSPRKGLPTSLHKSLFIQMILSISTNTIFEAFSRLIQMSWMRRHQTKEVITKQVLAFHPNDYRTKTIRRLRLKTRQFGLLTKF